MKFIVFSFLLCFFSVLHARPISYPGGWTVMQMNGWRQSRVHVHYSPLQQYSLGVNVEKYYRLDRFDFNGQWNYLLKRRNTRLSQFNMYFKTQSGVVFFEEKTSLGGAVGIALDWETRRYFMSYAASGSFAGGQSETYFFHQCRLGVAPYVGSFGDLHTWLMFQFEHHPGQKETYNHFVFTPIIRLFKGVYLMEFGFSNKMHLIFNWMVRF